MGFFTSSKDKKKKINIEEAEKFLANIKQQNKLQSISTNISLKKDERAYFEEDVTLSETRMVSKRTGVGVGFRVFKGVFVGTTKGESRSMPELRNIDVGKLTLTNKRLIFDGSTENRVNDLDKILSVETYIDAIEVSLENKVKSAYFFVKNPFIWSTVFKIIRGVPNPENLKGVNIDIKFQ